VEFRMRVAITGATGFLGRYLVRQLDGAGHDLRCWHRPGSDRGGFEGQAGAIEWLPGSLGDPAAARDLVRGADAVVHAAVQWEGPRILVDHECQPTTVFHRRQSGVA
jgi:nucleoside-diphosphate-sugar epimerase